jgi:REP-associated tyrosine transposase
VWTPLQLVRYIHLNPQKHGLVSDSREWPYSSHQAYLSNQPTRLQRDAVLGWFDGAQGFVAAHQIPIDDQVLAPLTPEDFD